jgi:alkanesulfonate monooxygenase SsuD/methylene tetrahydromethanopterin reductase-like flavin-dependent oxidoreductase (luciferase family)
MFGYDFGDVPTRVARMEEGLQVITQLLRSPNPVTFNGRFYKLEEAMLLPKPQRSNGPSILVGGAGLKRTLPMVARYADIWNATRLTPDEFRARSAQLDELARERVKEQDLRTAFLDKKKQAVNLEAYRKQLAEIEESFGEMLKQGSQK